MACRLCKKNPVWKFTNQGQLCRNCFVRYFEKKVKGTIRKYKMPIGVVKGDNVKVKIINEILRGLPQRKGKLSAESLNDISNEVLYVMMCGNKDKLKKLIPHNQPLYFLSDKEILLYTKINGVKGKLKPIKDKKIRKVDGFIKKIEEKNPDIRHNVVNSLLRI